MVILSDQARRDAVTGDQSSALMGPVLELRRKRERGPTAEVLHDCFTWGIPAPAS